MSHADLRSTLILGVDDNARSLKLLRAILEAAGFSFVGAESGARCLETLWRVQPKLILLDVQMPELDGFETCRRIRALFPDLPAPILFVTAANTSEDLKAALSAGGDDFILKPYEPAKLLARVESWLRQGRTAAPRPSATRAGAAPQAS